MSAQHSEFENFQAHHFESLHEELKVITNTRVRITTEDSFWGRRITAIKFPIYFCVFDFLKNGQLLIYTNAFDFLFSYMLHLPTVVLVWEGAVAVFFAFSQHARVILDPTQLA